MISSLSVNTLHSRVGSIMGHDMHHPLSFQVGQRALWQRCDLELVGTDTLTAVYFSSVCQIAGVCIQEVVRALHQGCNMYMACLRIPVTEVLPYRINMAG